MQPEALKFCVFDPIIFHYFTIILIIFELLALLQNKKNCYFGWYLLRKSGHLPSPSQGSVFLATNSRIDSIGEHQHALSHGRADRFHDTVRVILTDVRKPSRTQCRTKHITQGIN